MIWTATWTLAFISVALFCVEMACLYFFKTQKLTIDDLTSSEQAVLSNIIRLPVRYIYIFTFCYVCLLGISCLYYHGFTVLFGLQFLSLLMNITLYLKVR